MRSIMSRAVSIILFLLVGPVVVEAYDSVDDPRRWAIVGLNIIGIETGEINSDQAIIIENGVIKAVGTVASVDFESVDIFVNLDGQYAIPGLWDMHVHFRGGPDLIDANERWLRQYLGYGVTAVRESGGDIPGSVLHWKASISRGFIKGPRIYSALLKLDGPGSRQSGAIPIGSSADIDSALDNLRFMGADFVKLYEMSYPPELFTETIRRAESQGFRTAGHAPLYVPFRELIDAGLDSVEHVFFLAKATNPDDDTLSEQMKRLELWDPLEYVAEYAKMTGQTDESYARATFRQMVRSETAMVPTLVIETYVDEFLAGIYEISEREQSTPLGIRMSHNSTIEWMNETLEAQRKAYPPLLQHAAEFIMMAANEGVMVLAGTDTGAGNPFVYPGDSLHQELQVLVENGLSTLQALQAATTNPANWMGLQETFGSIAAGKVADIVVLDANPLDDIANTRSISAVVHQGVFFDKEELRSLRQLVGEQ